MISQIYKVNIPESKTTGSIFLSARPRGGDWLEDEIANWRNQGINTVVSLLTTSEEEDLDLLRQGIEANAAGINFISVPIEDRDVPRDADRFRVDLGKIESALNSGRNILLDCRQGIGRTGLVAASLLLHYGLTANEALELLTQIRGVTVPETPEQRNWLISFSQQLLIST